MRRDPIIGQAIPGGEFQDRQVRCEESECAAKCRQSRTIAADNDQAHSRSSAAPAARSARQIGNDKALRPVGYPHQGQRTAGNQIMGRIARNAHRAPCTTSAEVAQSPKQRGIEIRRDIKFAGHPCKKLAVRHLHQVLEIDELVGRELLDRALGKAPHDQIQFPHAAMPGSEQKLAAASIQSFARTTRHHLHHCVETIQ